MATTERKLLPSLSYDHQANTAYLQIKGPEDFGGHLEVVTHTINPNINVDLDIHHKTLVGIEIIGAQRIPNPTESFSLLRAQIGQTLLAVMTAGVFAGEPLSEEATYSKIGVIIGHAQHIMSEAHYYGPLFPK